MPRISVYNYSDYVGRSALQATDQLLIFAELLLLQSKSLTYRFGFIWLIDLDRFNLEISRI